MIKFTWNNLICFSIHLKKKKKKLFRSFVSSTELELWHEKPHLLLHLSLIGFHFLLPLCLLSLDEVHFLLHLSMNGAYFLSLSVNLSLCLLTPPLMYSSNSLVSWLTWDERDEEDAEGRRDRLGGLSLSFKSCRTASSSLSEDPSGIIGRSCSWIFKCRNKLK